MCVRNRCLMPSRLPRPRWDASGQNRQADQNNHQERACIAHRRAAAGTGIVVIRPMPGRRDGKGVHEVSPAYSRMRTREASCRSPVEQGPTPVGRRPGPGRMRAADWPRVIAEAPMGCGRRHRAKRGDAGNGDHVAGRPPCNGPTLPSNANRRPGGPGRRLLDTAETAGPFRRSGRSPWHDGGAIRRPGRSRRSSAPRCLARVRRPRPPARS